MEKTIKIKFTQMSEVYDFFDEMRKFESDIDLLSCQNHRYCVDAKSIMGVLALNIFDVLKVKMINGDSEEIEKFTKAMEKYKYEENK